MAAWTCMSVFLHFTIVVTMWDETSERLALNLTSSLNPQQTCGSWHILVCAKNVMCGRSAATTATESTVFVDLHGESNNLRMSEPPLNVDVFVVCVLWYFQIGNSVILSIL
jgi:hypothetical protein